MPWISKQQKLYGIAEGLTVRSRSACMPSMAAWIWTSWSSSSRSISDLKKRLPSAVGAGIAAVK
jgi:hypothetical protein